jgi:hypothetical protein
MMFLTAKTWVQIRFMVDKVAIHHDFLRLLYFPFLIIIPQLLRIHLSPPTRCAIALRKQYFIITWFIRYELHLWPSTWLAKVASFTQTNLIAITRIYVWIYKWLNASNSTFRLTFTAECQWEEPLECVAKNWNSHLIVLPDEEFKTNYFKIQQTSHMKHFICFRLTI